MKNYKYTLLVALLVAGVPALAETVVVVSPRASTGPLTAAQASQFFLGKSDSMTPVDQAAGAPVRADFYRKTADLDANQVKAIWSRLIFTGRAAPPKELSSSADVKKAIAADPKLIGYIEKSAVDDTVKVVLSLP